MFHKRCDRLIAHLEEQNEALRQMNEALVQSLADEKGVVVPTFTERQGEVYYMDDARELELQENGETPT
jgi:hypothetical protein